MLRSCRNKKWNLLILLVVLFSFAIPILSVNKNAYADNNKRCFFFTISNNDKTYSTNKICAQEDDQREIILYTSGEPTSDDFKIRLSTDHATLRINNKNDDFKDIDCGTKQGELCYKGFKDFQRANTQDTVSDVDNSFSDWLGSLANYFTSKGWKLGLERADDENAPSQSTDSTASNGGGTSGTVSGDTSITDQINGTTGSTDDARDCMNSGAAATLGWIVCPVLNWLTGAANTIYETFLEPALQVAPQLFTNGGSTYQGWEFFRNLANGLMIILLLFVIFSQVTGVGIDNYGIKKTLPKIIVAAILMNLSYWICIAAVDLSNIIGNGLQQMFLGLAEGITIPPIEIGEGVTAAIQTGTLSTAVTILVAIAGASGAIWALKNNLGGIALLIAVSAISVLVSILTLFIILAARQAAIVVLVVISPLAMACYMLPNTQSLFKKWLKFLQTLLLVYPIAGLLVGGGNYVSTLLLGTGMANNLFGAVTAMITGIIPIFFIPSVLRRSLSLAGDIGNKISGVGRNIGRRTSGAVDRGVKNTEAWKHAQDYRARMRTKKYENRVDRRLNNKMNSVLSSTERSQLSALNSKFASGADMTEAEMATMEALRKKKASVLSDKQLYALGQSREKLLSYDKQRQSNLAIADNDYYRAMGTQQDLQLNNAKEAVLMHNIADVNTSTLTKAANQRRQQLVEAKDWSKADFKEAMEKKQDAEHTVMTEQLMVNLNPKISEMEINKAKQAVHQRLNDANNWTDKTYLESQIKKSDTESEEERANMSTWVTDQNKVAAIQARGRVARLNEEGQNRNWANAGYQKAIQAQNAKKEQDQATTAQAVLLREQYGRGTMDTLMADWNKAFQNGSADLDAITSAGHSLYGNNFLNAMGRSLNNMQITDGSGNIRNENIRQSMSRLRQYSQDNSSFSSAMTKKNSDVARMINSGGITGSHLDANGNTVLEYAELSHYSAQGVTENKLEDWNTQSSDAWRRAIDTGGVTGETITQMEESTDPAILRGAMSNATTRNVIDTAQANIQAGQRMNYGLSDNDINTTGAMTDSQVRTERVRRERVVAAGHRQAKESQRQAEQQAAAQTAQKQQQAIQDIRDAVINPQNGGPQGGP